MPLVVLRTSFFHGLNEGSYAPLHVMVIANFFKNNLLFSRYSNSQPKSAQDTFGRRGSKLFKKIALHISSLKKNNSKLVEKITFMTFLNAIQMKGHDLPKGEILNKYKYQKRIFKFIARKCVHSSDKVHACRSRIIHKFCFQVHLF